MEKREIQYIAQLITTLENTEAKLEKAHKGESTEEFNILKKFILQIQRKISEVLK
jgi:hypothetical protein